MKRREFLEVGSVGAIGAVASGPADASQGRGLATARVTDRALWVSVARNLAEPVLTNLAAATLKARMPVEETKGAGRQSVTHLEAFGRLLCGLAPWLELSASDGSGEEYRLCSRYADLARAGLAQAVNPASPDFLNFTTDRQPLVDAAFLGHALIRAPRALREPLSTEVRGRLIKALESTRVIKPAFSNWLLFSAMVETALYKLGASWDRMRVDYALREHAQWYKGDGVYGDGPEFHFDYYNSFVIQPTLIDVLETLGPEDPSWAAMTEVVRKRAQRYAAIQERMISPEGTFPPIGRSIAYRFGALQLLAQMALRRELPKEISPAQVRSAMTAVIRRQTEAANTFDPAGWLTIGFCGHQPGVGETYISTGSVYLCSVGLLPLGLSENDPFWTAPAESWTQKRAWSGESFPIDHAHSES